MLVMVAFGMTALLGVVALSVDYGSLVMDANRLQRGCDAAALAGAARLNKTGIVLLDKYNATVDAQKVAWQNDKVPIQPTAVLFPDNRTVKVTSSVTRSFFFGPAIGVSNGVVKRSATAAIRPVNTLTTQGSIRVAPIGITWETYNAYKNDQLNDHDIQLVRQNKTTFGLNDMVLFDLRDNSAKSGAQMADQLRGTELEDVSLGDYETTLNAAGPAETDKLTDALDDLFAQAAGAPWYDTETDTLDGNDAANGTIARSNPRIVYIIVTPGTTSANNGTFNTQIQGFVPVYIEDYYFTDITSSTGKSKGKGKLAETGLFVKMRFLPTTVASDNDLPTASDTATVGSGLYSISLTD